MIQNFAKDSGLTVIDSLIKAIEQYKHNEEIDSLELRIREINEKVTKAFESMRGIKMFDDVETD